MSAPEALSALAEARAGLPPAVVVLRALGPYVGALAGLPLPDAARRRAKADTVAIVAGGRPVVVAACSTWPFRDQNPPTKAIVPRDYPAALAISPFGAAGNRRDALCNHGFTFVAGYTWASETSPRPRGIERIVGFAIHDDRGASEGCVTVAHQQTIADLIAALDGGKLPGARKHSDGRWCYDLLVREVHSC